MAEEVSQWYERSISQFLPESLLLYFAYADYEEVINSVIFSSSRLKILCILVFGVVMGQNLKYILFLLFGLRDRLSGLIVYTDYAG